MVEEMLSERGIGVTYETVRQWEKKFGKAFSDQIRKHAPARRDKWHMDEVVVSIAGEQVSRSRTSSGHTALRGRRWAFASIIASIRAGLD